MSESPDADEIALIRSAQRGDRAAFEQLVHRTARLVFSRLYLQTGDAHRAEDLSQETFLVAWRSIGQVTEPAGFRAWLLSIACTVAIDARRRESRLKRATQPHSLEDAAMQAQDTADGPGQLTQLEEEKRRVLQVLRDLPEEYRLPLTLRYIGGADYDEIGKQLGLTNGSLRGLLHRGIARLRSELTRNDPPENRS